ncbi:hypothetical protein D3C73_990410 [compost metagenome]
MQVVALNEFHSDSAGIRLFLGTFNVRTHAHYGIMRGKHDAHRIGDAVLHHCLNTVFNKRTRMLQPLVAHIFHVSAALVQRLLQRLHLPVCILPQRKYPADNRFIAVLQLLQLLCRRCMSAPDVGVIRFYPLQTFRRAVRHHKNTNFCCHGFHLLLRIVFNLYPDS